MKDSSTLSSPVRGFKDAAMLALQPSKMEEYLLRVYISLLFCLSMRPPFSQAWTTRKCVVYEDPTILLDLRLGCQPMFEFQNRTLAAVCTNVTKLQEDLSDLPGDLQALCIAGSIRTIHSNALSQFHQLLHLTLNIPVTTIKSGAFHGLPNLQNLSICHSLYPKCNNVSLAQDIFLGLRALKTLILDFVCLEHINTLFLSPSAQLQVMSLSFADINEISTVFRIFQGMQSVHRLALSNNYIETVQLIPEFEQWKTFPNILELDLSFNRVRKIIPGTFRGWGLRSLILSFAPLSLNDLLYSGLETLDNLFLQQVDTNKSDIINTSCSFVSKSKLKSLILKNNDIVNISGKSLAECWSLVVFDLSKNRINYLENDFLNRFPHLRILDLSYNRELKLDLCPSPLENGSFVSPLQSLLFSYNNVTVIKSKQFWCMPNLQELDLHENPLEMVEPLGFYGLLQLKNLNLNNNYLKQINSQTLSGMPNLITLDIKSHTEVQFQSKEFRALKYLRVLSLYSCRIELTPEDLPQLNHLSINSDYSIHIKCMSDKCISSVQVLILNAITITIDTKNTSLFHNVRELTMPFNGDITFNRFQVSFYQMFPLLERLFYQQFLGAQLYRGLTFSNLTYLRYLTVFNLCASLEDPSGNLELIFQNLFSLECLTMSDSGIKYITYGTFKSMNSLRVLTIVNDALITLENGFQGSLVTLKYFYLFKVTIQCDCANDWLFTWVLTTKEIFFTSLNNVICIEKNTKHNFLKFLQESCEQHIEFFLFLFTSIFLLLIISASLSYKSFNSYFQNMLYIFRAWLHRLRGRRGGPIKYQYDAFVSYSSWDEDWIQEHLIPKMEQTGPPFLKLCLHSRDFELGKAVVDNITDSIYKSRKTICVISHNYLRSDWCSLEMNVATHRLLAENEDILILVFLEQISRYQLSAYHGLARMVKKKTYIDWAEDDIEKQDAFWERLKRAIENTDDENNDLHT